MSNKNPTFFLDESGDTTFYNGKIPIIGTNGVSNAFMLGMVEFAAPLNTIRQAVSALQHKIINGLFERGEIRYHNFLKDKITVIDLYDNRAVYDTENPLTADHKL
ncbi:MAG: hypothetical protein RI894_2194 [Bacteroidota bacterium]